MSLGKAHLSPTVRKVGQTMEPRNVGCSMLNVCHGPRGWAWGAPHGPPTPIYEKTIVSRNDFLNKRNKKNKKIKSNYYLTPLPPKVIMTTF